MKLINPDFKEKVEEILKRYPYVEVHIQQIQHEDQNPSYLINVYDKETHETGKCGYLGRSKVHAVVDKESIIEWRKFFQSRSNVDLFEFQVNLF